MSGASNCSPWQRLAVAWSNECSPAKRWNCFGFSLVERGQRRVPPPPARITGRIIFAPDRTAEVAPCSSGRSGLHPPEIIDGVPEPLRKLRLRLPAQHL